MLIVIELFFGVNQARDGYRFKKEIHGRVYTLTGVAPEPMFFMGSLALPSPPCVGNVAVPLSPCQGCVFGLESKSGILLFYARATPPASATIPPHRFATRGDRLSQTEDRKFLLKKARLKHTALRLRP